MYKTKLNFMENMINVCETFRFKSKNTQLSIKASKFAALKKTIYSVNFGKIQIKYGILCSAFGSEKI